MKKEKKPKSKTKLKKDLWKVFSVFIRRRDKGRCFTCGSTKEWKWQDAGHFIPKSICGEYLYFDERNVNCQCTACNRFRHGNLSYYSYYLIKKYGPGVIGELHRIKDASKSMPYSVMLSKYNHYKELNKNS